jgi:hypothetical protein
MTATRLRGSLRLIAPGPAAARACVVAGPLQVADRACFGMLPTGGVDSARSVDGGARPGLKPFTACAEA